MSGIAAFFSDYTIQMVIIGSALLGLTSGVLGSFALLRRQGLVGDVVSHAALPGIAAAFILTGTRHNLVLMIGAALSGWLAILLVNAVVKGTRIKQDSSLGIILSVFFGFGLMLLTYIQRSPDAAQAGLETFLFGQAASLLLEDVLILAVAGVLLLGVTKLFWRRLALVTFDSAYAATIGIRVNRYEALLSAMLVIVIVMGLQMVGVVLMSAMVVAPAAAARQWTDRLGRMVILAGIFGAFAGVAGAVLSAAVEKLPTGPMIIVVLGFIAAVSLLFAPGRGFYWVRKRHKRRKQTLEIEEAVLALYALWVSHGGKEHGHKLDAIIASGRLGPNAEGTMRAVVAAGFAVPVTAESWCITHSGMERALQLLVEDVNDR